MNDEELDSLAPREFEELVASIFSSEGYGINITSPTRDGGVDVFAERLNNLELPDRWIIECKHYKKDRPIGVEIVRQLVGVKSVLNSRNAALVTTSRFTKDARSIAERAGVDLVDRQKLLNWVENTTKADVNRGTVRKDFQTVFISHSHADHEFVTQLNSELREQGVRTWFSHDNLDVGEKIHESIFSAIDSFDRLIVVLSEESMKSNWVTTELHRAMRRQRNEGSNVLFPISLVPFEQIENWSCFDSDTGTDIAVELRKYLIPVLEDSSDSNQFQQLVQNIVKALSLDD